MIIGTKTTGFPVPGMNFGGRQVFIEVKPGDTEDALAQYAAYMCTANKMMADLLAAPATNLHRLEAVDKWMAIWESTGIKMDHTVERNFDPLTTKEILT